MATTPATNLDPKTGLTGTIYAAKQVMTKPNDNTTIDEIPDAVPNVNPPVNIYILYYRHGMNPQCQKGFTFNGDLKGAVERAKQHCQRMGYRYIFVRPLINNLEDDEKYKDQYGAVI